jgi:ligand-binding sensor domain-containing protein
LHYTIEDGLPSNQVFDVIQDDDGFLWIATDRGVSKFDGKKFINYTTSDGLLNNTVFKWSVYI